MVGEDRSKPYLESMWVTDRDPEPFCYQLKFPDARLEIVLNNGQRVFVRGGGRKPFPKYAKHPWSSGQSV